MTFYEFIKNGSSSELGSGEVGEAFRAVRVAWQGDVTEGTMKTRAKAKVGARFAVLAVCLVISWFLLVTGAWAKPTTVGQARQVVANWLSLYGRPLGAAMGRQIRDVATFTDSSGDPMYYVVALNPAGLVFVPADDLAEPIVGFAPGATLYDPSPANPLGALVSRDLPGRVLQARKVEQARAGAGEAAPVGFRNKAQRKWARLENPAADRLDFGLPGAPQDTGLPDISEIVIPPMIQSKWGQTAVEGYYCYNYFTPNRYPCGCTATAVAQIMRYFQHPTGGVDSTVAFPITVDGVKQNEYLLGGDLAGGPYEWDKMPLEPLKSGVTDDERRAIGALTHDAGVAGCTAYTAKESATDLTRMISALIGQFGYRATSTMDNTGNLPTQTFLDLVNPNLANGSPVLLWIYSPTVSHAVVCDGLGYNVANLYHHLNMGWDGQYDLWYNLPTVDSSPSFPSVHGGIGHIYPEDKYDPEATELIGGRVSDWKGVPVKGASIVAISNDGAYKYGATSNEKGVFVLKVHKGTYCVLASDNSLNWSAFNNVIVPYVVKNYVWNNSIWLELKIGNVYGTSFKMDVTFLEQKISYSGYGMRNFNFFKPAYKSSVGWYYPEISLDGYCSISKGMTPTTLVSGKMRNPYGGYYDKEVNSIISYMFRIARKIPEAPLNQKIPYNIKFDLISRGIATCNIDKGGVSFFGTSSIAKKPAGYCTASSFINADALCADKYGEEVYTEKVGEWNHADLPGSVFLVEIKSKISFTHSLISHYEYDSKYWNANAYAWSRALTTLPQLDPNATVLINGEEVPVTRAYRIEISPGMFVVQPNYLGPLLLQ